MRRPESQWTKGSSVIEHPTRSEPARDVVFIVRDGFIEEILELPVGRTLGAVLIEPEQLGAYYGPDRAQRELISLEDLPLHLVDAIVAVEDQRFEVHPGIDVRRIGGALLANLRAGGIRQGGSTLTQQLVKNFFLTPERTLKRKAHEAVMALLVELRYDKREILETYLNEIYLGQRGSTAIHGVGEAALRFFGKPAQNLSLAESALLAALIQSPNGISPYRNPKAARERRDLVLQLMAEQGRVKAAQRDAAIAEPLSLAAITPDPRDARYFLDFLRIQLSDSYDATVLSSQGIKVYSTLESRTQRLAAIALREALEPQDQVLTLAEAVEAYTLGGARMLGIDEQIGSVEVGKKADLILLDQNLFEIDVAEIPKTKVIATMFDGKFVHDIAFDLGDSDLVDTGKYDDYRATPASMNEER